MRHTRIIILILAVSFWGCKTSSVTSSTASSYSEDLTQLRPEMTPLKNNNKDLVVVQNDGKVPNNHLKAELDSVNQIIIANNLSREFVDGYTIQIYTGNDRKEADRAAETASYLLLDIDPKVEYAQPNYKVKVGQYVNRLEAHEVFEKLKESFPLALLIPDRIRVTYD
ncbi:MAG: SPOR domain-containing protein [Cyclobacteriaceae bacterium]